MHHRHGEIPFPQLQRT